MYGPSLAQQIIWDKILLPNLILGDDSSSFFLIISLFFFLSVFFSLFHVFLLFLIFTKTMLLLSFFSINIFFHENYFSFFMFRDVPECSGMFHVPDFIDALPNHEELCNTKLTCKHRRTGTMRLGEAAPCLPEKITQCPIA